MTAVARITRLFVHPIKGVSPIEVGACDLDALGARDDRRWMVVSPDGRFLSQRSHPRMALVRVAFADGGLVLNAPGARELVLDAEIARPAAGLEQRVTVWNDSVDARPIGNGASEWLARALDVPCTLVWMADRTVRTLPATAVAGLDHDRRVSFADAFPLLLVSAESIDALNDRIASKPDGERPHITVERFRPNVVISGAGAHAEDGWRHIAMGNLRFLVAKPCARCAVPTVDPTTGERGTEPTRTLATYRRHDGHVWFGQNLVHDGTGRVAVGDDVRIEEHATHRNPPL